MKQNGKAALRHFLTSGSELHILSPEAVSALVKDWSSANLLGGAASAFPCELPMPIQHSHREKLVDLLTKISYTSNRIGNGALKPWAH